MRCSAGSDAGAGGTSLNEFAPAKVNLHLHVVGRRSDGYHLLDSLVVFPAVGDRLSVAPSDRLSLTVTGPFAAGLSDGDDNLVLRAARALGARAGRMACGKVLLEKHLPIASGIGGGSADAAATLRLLCRFWTIEPSVADLDQLAGELGADVKACLASTPALMSGIGEVLAPAPALPAGGLVLVNPGVAVSTPAVFQARMGQFSSAAGFRGDGWPDARSLAGDLAAARNDLEPSARLLAPVIDVALGALSAMPDCLLARMSGSGATCFGLFDTPDAARRAAGRIERAGWWVWGGGIIGN